MKKLLFLSAIAFLSFSSSAVGQQKKVTQPISAGVLNGKALSLPKPEYPPDAARVKQGGTVKVQVLIDESGSVVSATGVGGLENVSLRIAAEAAALKATFSPTRLSGQPVKVSGVIVYNFVAEKSNEELLRIFSVSTFLPTIRAFANDLEKTEEIFETDDLIKEVIPEFPEYAAELKPLAELKKMSPARRIEVIDKALATIGSKLEGSEKWQFQVGKSLGNTFGYVLVFMANAKNPEDLYKINDAPIKLELNTIRDLLLSCPSDFPRDVRQKLSQLADLGIRESLASPAAQKEFLERVTDLIEVISPDEAK